MERLGVYILGGLVVFCLIHLSLIIVCWLPNPRDEMGNQTAVVANVLYKLSLSVYIRNKLVGWMTVQENETKIEVLIGKSQVRQ